MTITDSAHVTVAKALRQQLQHPRPAPDPHLELVRGLADYDRAFGPVDGFAKSITDDEVARW